MAGRSRSVSALPFVYENVCLTLTETVYLERTAGSTCVD